MCNRFCWPTIVGPSTCFFPLLIHAFNIGIVFIWWLHHILTEEPAAVKVLKRQILNILLKRSNTAFSLYSRLGKRLSVPVKVTLVKVGNYFKYLVGQFVKKLSKYMWHFGLYTSISILLFILILAIVALISWKGYVDGNVSGNWMLFAFSQ